MESFYFYLIFYNSLEKMMIQGLAHRDPASWHLKKISESHSEQALQDKMGHHNVSYFFFTKFYKLLRTKTVPQVIRILRIFFQLSFSLTKKKKEKKKVISHLKVVSFSVPWTGLKQVLSILINISTFIKFQVEELC